MATPSLQHRVLFNDDLLEIVLVHMDRSDIANLRLCNKTLHSVASTPMFRTLLISSRGWHLDRLDFIAEHEVFKRGVREIVWEAFACGRGSAWPEFEAWEMGRQLGIHENEPFDEWGGVPRNKVHEIFQATEGLADAEKCQWEDERDELEAEVRDALRELEGLKHVVMTSWYGGEDGTRAVLIGDNWSNTYLPPFWLLPLAKAVDPDLLRRRQNQAFETIVKALSAAGRIPKAFTISPAYKVNRAPHSIELFQGTMMDFNMMPQLRLQTWTDPLLHLTTLHLNFERNSAVVQELIGNVEQAEEHEETNNVMEFFKQLFNVEDLYIRMPSCLDEDMATYTAVVSLQALFGGTTFRKLHTLNLASFWFEAGELCSFLERHESSITHLTLCNVTIGGTQSVSLVSLMFAEGHPKIKILYPDYLRTALFTAQREQGAELPDLQGWKQVARTCRKLTKLEGLRIEAASVTENLTMLSVFECEELEEEGMDGRENVLASACEGGVWGHLEQLGY